MHALFALVANPGVSIAAFVVISLALLVIGFLIWQRGGWFDTNLIMLGLVVAVAAVGYGSLVTGDASASVSATGGGASVSAGTGLAGVLIRLGVILVLAGVASGLLARWQGAPPTNGPNT